MNRIKAQLQGEFEMKDLESAKRILRMEIVINMKVGTFFLS